MIEHSSCSRSFSNQCCLVAYSLLNSLTLCCIRFDYQLWISLISCTLISGTVSIICYFLGYTNIRDFDSLDREVCGQMQNGFSANAGSESTRKVHHLFREQFKLLFAITGTENLVFFFTIKLKCTYSKSLSLSLLLHYLCQWLRRPSHVCFSEFQQQLLTVNFELRNTGM